MYATLPDGTKIYYQTFGAERVLKNDNLIEKPTLIFLHGGPGLADQVLYIPFWSQLQNVAQVVFIDMRGHGLSGGWDQIDKFNLASWAADIKDFCAVTGITKPIIVGFSFGGWVALKYAITYPDHPGALICCNTEAHVDVEVRANAYQKKVERRGGKNGKEVADIVRKLGSGTIPSSQTAQLYIETCAPLFSETIDYSNTWEHCKQNPKAWEVFDEHEQFKFDLRNQLYKITTSVLVISGELDAEHPPQCSREMYDKMVNAKERKYCLIENAADPVYQDQPGKTLNVLIEYICDLYPQVRPLMEV